jgi:hypothetical protein
MATANPVLNETHLVELTSEIRGCEIRPFPQGGARNIRKHVTIQGIHHLLVPAPLVDHLSYLARVIQINECHCPQVYQRSGHEVVQTWSNWRTTKKIAKESCPCQNPSFQ